MLDHSDSDSLISKEHVPSEDVIKASRRVTFAEAIKPTDGFHISEQYNSADTATQNGLRTLLGHKIATQRLWNPIWLTTTSLGLFVAVFASLTITLVALYATSTTRSGLVTQNAVYRYTWTYGPTAVLVLVASLWMRVDYWCKVLVPFERMRKTATPARQTILQDYLSPWNLSVLVDSLKNKDFSVALAISCTLLLQLTTIVSTSLMLLESREIATTGSVTVSQEFVSSAPRLLDLDGGAAARLYGIATGRLPNTATTSSNLTVENFWQNQTSHSNSSYTAKVAGVSTTLDCQPLDLGNDTYRVAMPWTSINAPGFAIDIKTPDCTILGVPVGLGVSHNPPHTDVTSQYQGWWANFTCNNNVRNYNYPLFAPYRIDLSRPVFPAFTDKRLVFITSHVQWTPDLGNGTNRFTWVQDLTAVMCKPSYNIDDYMVTYSPRETNQSQPFSAVKHSNGSRQIDGLSNDDLSSFVNWVSSRSAIFSSSKNGVLREVQSDFGYLRSDDPFFLIMNEFSGGSDATSLLNQGLLNQTKLLEYVPKTFSGLMAQIFDSHFMAPTDRVVSAELISLQDRLVLKTLPAALMMAFLTLTLVGAICLIFLRPINVVSLDPQAISSKAKLLASSPFFAKTLQKFSGARMKSTYDGLSIIDYYSEVVPSNNGLAFKITQKPSMRTPPFANSNAIEGRHVWWRPKTHNIWFMVALVFSILSIIVVLEVLQHVSDSQNGLLTFEEWQSRHIFITAIPAAVMSIVALTFATLNFNVSLLAPFTALRRAPIPHQRGLDAVLIGRPSMYSMYLSATQLLLLPMFSIAAVIIGSFLTIIISGLYYVESVPLTTTALLTQLDAFNYTKVDLKTADKFAGVATNLIYFENSTYPRGTYEHFVFPTYELVGNSEKNLSRSHLTVQVPAIRPKLKCLTISPEQLSWEPNITYRTTDALSNITAYTNVSSFVELPCYENLDGTGKILNCKYRWNMNMFLVEGQTDEIVGKVTMPDRANKILQCFGYPPGNETTSGDFRNIAYHPLADGCPSLMYAYGTVSTKRIDNKTLIQTKPNIYGALCFQNMEQVETQLTLNLPDLSINTTAPPEPLEDTAKIIDITSANGKYTGPNYNNSIETLVWSLGKPYTTLMLDPVFSAMFNGTPHFNPTDLLGFQGLPKLMSAMNDLYATYMVQAINSNFRYNLTGDTDTGTSTRLHTPSSPISRRQTTTTSSSPPPEYTGVITDPLRQRLKQQPQLKITLQSMLAAMTICALVIFVLSDRTPILPHNPCSLAGTMVLLAGSEMATRTFIPEGAEWDSHFNNIWDGWFFSLGWWGTQEHPRYGIDVGKAERSRWDLPRKTSSRASQRSKDNYRDSDASWQQADLFHDVQRDRGVYRDSIASTGGYNETRQSNGFLDEKKHLQTHVEVYEMHMFENGHEREGEHGRLRDDGERERESVDLGDMGYRLDFRRSNTFHGRHEVEQRDEEDRREHHASNNVRRSGTV